MKSQMLHEHAAIPQLGRLQGTRSLANFTPANQLLLKIPKVPTDGAMRPNHPVNNWVQNVGD